MVHLSPRRRLAWLAALRAWTTIAVGELTQLLGPRVATSLAYVEIWLAAPSPGSVGAVARSGRRCFASFNRGFEWTANVYMGMVCRLLRLSVVALVAYGGLLFLTYGSFQATPKGFIPSQDKGYLLVNVQLPDSASVQRTQRVMRQH